MAKEKRPDHSKKFAVGTAVAGLLGIAGAAAYSPIYRRYYDAEVMHYSSAKAVYLFGFIIAASLLAALLTAVVLRKNLSRSPSELGMSGASRFFRFLSGFLFVGLFIYALVKGGWASESVYDKVSLWLMPFVGISMVVGTTSLRKKWVGCLTSLLPVIWTGVLVFGYYFSRADLPINSPEKNLTNVVIAALLLFLLSESRDCLDDLNPVLCIFSTVSAAFVAGTVSIARIVMHFACGLDHPTLIVNILFLSMALCAAARIPDVESALKEKPIDVLDELLNGGGESEETAAGEAEDAPAEAEDAEETGDAADGSPNGDE